MIIENRARSLVENSRLFLDNHLQRLGKMAASRFVLVSEEEIENFKENNILPFQRLHRYGNLLMEV